MGLLRTMESVISSRAVVLLIICTSLSFLCGSGGEVPPPPPTSGVTLLPPVKPDGPHAYPEAEKSNLPMFTIDYPRIQIPFEITLWMLLASFSKIGE